MSRMTRGARPRGPHRGMPAIQSVRVGRVNTFLPLLPAPPEWTTEALCAQTDPDAFFPEKGGTTRAAKAVCARCDVRELCLAYALERRERYGVWGGLSERERRLLLPQPAATEPDETEEAA